MRGVQLRGQWRLSCLPAAPVVGQRDLEHVVDRDQADDPAVLVHHRDGDQVVVGHQHGDVDDVGVGPHPHRVRVAHVDEAGLPVRLQQGDELGHAAQAAVAVHGVHAGQRLRLQRGGGNHGGNGLRYRRVGWQGQEIDPHQAAGAGRIEAHQGQDLGADPGRQQIDDRLPPVLRQLGDRVGRVVGPHPAQHFGDLFVRARAEQPGGPILVEFLEDVRLQLGVLVHLPEDLGLFLLRRVLQQVSDLGRLEPPDAAERATQQRAAGVPDQRLERLPVPETPRVRAGRSGPAQREGPEQPRRPAARIHADHHPLTVAASQLDVRRPDQARGLHIDEPVTEHVPLQQHLTGTPLEMPKIEPVAGQPQNLAVGAPDLLDRHVDLTAADRGDQTGDHRVVVTAETGDDVG